MTDAGPAIVKYIGNRQGVDALIGEYVCGHLAQLLGLEVPDFAVVEVPSIPLPEEGINVEEGPAFFSSWMHSATLAPNSELLRTLRYPQHISWLVVFDTWVRNRDRFFPEDGSVGASNLDNLLFAPDKRKTKMVVIDHTHALAQTALELELGATWITEQHVYGLFPQFVEFLSRHEVLRAIQRLRELDEEQLRRICGGAPAEWGMTTSLRDSLAMCLHARGARLSQWLPVALFGQLELEV